MVDLKDFIKQDVKEFLSNATIFDGLFKQVFEQHYREFIIQQLKLNLLRDLSYNLTFSEICDTISEEFLRSCTSDYFFEREFYESNM
jgi:hypothetical protein